MTHHYEDPVYQPTYVPLSRALELERQIAALQAEMERLRVENSHLQDQLYGYRQVAREERERREWERGQR